MDPSIWPEPEKFDPTRHEKGNDNHEYGYIAFGAGPRGCPGKRAYYNLAKALLGFILKRYTATAAYRGNENNGVDLDTFLPNRFVAWDTDGINITFTRR
jgi:cytochrome P450